ncbi:MAG: hypothetical protein RLZZ546_3298 [Bacteroidota bacterium]
MYLYPRLPSVRGTYIFDEELQMIHFKFVFENPITEQVFKNQKFVWKEMTFRDNILSARLVYDDSFPDSGSIQRDFEKIE